MSVHKKVNPNVKILLTNCGRHSYFLNADMMRKVTFKQGNSLACTSIREYTDVSKSGGNILGQSASKC